MTVEFTDRPEAALALGAELLASQPILHNLILSLLEARVRHPEPGRYWIASRDGETVGIAFQSPAHMPATITPMPDDAADAIVAAVALAGVRLPGVTGEARTAARFAGQWTEQGGVAGIPSGGMRIYELGRLVHPAPSGGRLRQAGDSDRHLVREWILGYSDDAGESRDYETTVGRRVDDGYVWIWDDAGPRSLAGHAAPAGGVARVGPVYTPPEHRNRGFAAACVAALSARLLDSGLRCMLYTDLGNPVSNSVYRRLGYRAVAECLHYGFAYDNTGP